MAELKCVLCGQPRQEAFRPFCSARCKQVDLHRWLTGSYAIPTVENEEKSESSPEGGEADQEGAS
ncbi:MAG: DNA gyrase inhibitor YacG [Holosporales bacterium]